MGAILLRDQQHEVENTERPPWNHIGILKAARFTLTSRLSGPIGRPWSNKCNDKTYGMAWPMLAKWQGRQR